MQFNIYKNSVYIVMRARTSSNRNKTRGLEKPRVLSSALRLETRAPTFCSSSTQNVRCLDDVKIRVIFVSSLATGE
jgi:hypothetical protein